MSVQTGPKIPVFTGADAGDTYGPAAMNRGWRMQQALVQCNVLALQNDPPVSPVNGDTYIVLVGTGAWAGQDNAIAYWTTQDLDNPAGVWEFYAPAEGWLAYDPNLQTVWKFDGTNWVPLLSISNGDSSANVSLQNDDATIPPTSSVSVSASQGDHNSGTIASGPVVDGGNNVVGFSSALAAVSTGGQVNLNVSSDPTSKPFLNVGLASEDGDTDYGSLSFRKANIDAGQSGLQLRGAAPAATAGSIQKYIIVKVWVGPGDNDYTDYKIPLYALA